MKLSVDIPIAVEAHVDMARKKFDLKLKEIDARQIMAVT